MELLEKLQLLELALDILIKIDQSSIDDRAKQIIKQKVLDIVDELSPTIQKRTLGKGYQENIVKALEQLGGRALRREIIDVTGLDPNIVSSILNKLYKNHIIDKIKIEKSVNRTGSGLKPEYTYVLLNGKDETL